MTAKSKPSYRVYEEHGSGRWRWEIATAEGRSLSAAAPVAPSRPVRRQLGEDWAKPKALTVARNINRREIRALPHPPSHCG